MAEWLRRGLQILARGFDSLRGLHCHAQSFCDQSADAGDDLTIPAGLAQEAIERQRLLRHHRDLET